MDVLNRVRERRRPNCLLGGVGRYLVKKTEFVSGVVLRRRVRRQGSGVLRGGGGIRGAGILSRKFLSRNGEE